MKQTEIKTIGLFGGTFDPIHMGHLIVAEAIRVRCRFDKIYFIPAKQHALKNNRHISLAIHRMKMLELAVRDNPFFAVSDIEIKRPGTSYTIDTIIAFADQFPANRFKLHFLIGSDVVNEFHRWREPEKLLRLCKFIAFGRKGAQIDPKAKYADAFPFVEVPGVEISASRIRQAVREEQSIRYQVPSVVENYIKTHDVYK